MTELIKLLNAYVDGKEFAFVDYDEEMTWFNMLVDWKVSFLWEETIYSKKFWFIDFLIDNELIDLNEMYSRVSSTWWHITNDEAGEGPNSELLLMMLAINNKPTDLILKLLKQWKEKE